MSIADKEFILKLWGFLCLQNLLLTASIIAFVI